MSNPALLPLSPARVAERIRAALDKTLRTETYQDPQESAERGRALRKQLSRSGQAAFELAQDRPDPVALLKEQGKTRLQALLPLRYERMGVSPFTFFRGAALIMAQDLSALPTTGIEVQLCGDAHVSNFGFYSSPERRTVFDLNDFDETLRGPWEWDVKRLAASLEICGRDRAFGSAATREAVVASAQAYRETMAELATMGNMDVYYAHFDVDDALLQGFDKSITKQEGKVLRKTVSKAKAKGSLRAVSKLTEVEDGKLRIISDPPVLVPARDAPEEFADVARKMVGGTGMADFVDRVLTEYRLTLSPTKRRLVEQYRGVDVGLKVVGVGSVGTRAWIVVLQGAGVDDPLVLQIKEAQESVLERFCGRAPQREHGKRVVDGQRAIQAVNDPLLGWCSLPDIEGVRHDYYVRQLWDGKGSLDLDIISEAGLLSLARACGITLARAHARTGNRFALAAYLGKSDKFDNAIADFATAYADQNERDYQRFMEAREAGELEVSAERA